MAPSYMTSQALVTVTVALLLSLQLLSPGVEAQSAHATFYGGSDASGTNDGACGYSNVFSLGYGSLTTALSSALFNNGYSCGGCYQVTCTGDSCLGGSVTVTATNLCPQGSFGGWCDSPNAHFDLSEPAFEQIAVVSAGHVSVSYQKVSCTRSGGIRFQITGHTYFMTVLVYNVGGEGDVRSVSVQGSNSGWIAMARNWGQVWSTATVLDGESLGFMVATGDGRSVTSSNAAGAGWSYGQTYEGSQF